MSDFFHPATEHKARVPHRCTYCGEPIAKGDFYKQQTGVWEGDWFRSYFHHECFADLCASGETEFTPYEQDRPKAEFA